MSILKRSGKRSVSEAEPLSARISSYQDLFWSRWQALSSRDQLALGVLLLFLLLFVGGYGGYTVHKAAKESKADYQQQVSDYFWLRSQAGNINSNALAAAGENGGAAQPPASQITALLNTSGINDAQVVAAGESIQLSFTNGSQAVISAALGQLEQQGWNITELTMQQDLVNKQIQVQARVTS